MSAEAAATITVQRVAADYFDAILASGLRSKGQWVSLFVVGAIYIAVAFFISDGDALGERLLIVVGLPALCLAVVFAGTVACYWFMARAVWRSPGASAAITYVFDDSGVTTRSELGEGRAVWAVFSAAFENGRSIVFRSHPGLLHIVPKRTQSSEVLDALRAQLRRNITGRVDLWGTI